MWASIISRYGVTGSPTLALVPEELKRDCSASTGKGQNQWHPSWLPVCYYHAKRGMSGKEQALSQIVNERVVCVAVVDDAATHSWNSDLIYRENYEYR